MSSVWQKLAIPFVGGVDTKTDGKLLKAPALTVLENGVFAKHGSVKRRAGYDVTLPATLAGIDITDPAGLATFNDELLLAADGVLYSRDTVSDTWLAAGPLAYVTTEQSPLASTNSAQQFADICTASGVTVAAWQDSRGGVYVSAYSADSGTPYATDQLLDVNGSAPAVVTVNGAILVFWYNSSSFDIKVLRILPATVAASIAVGGVTVRADANTTVGAWDVVSLGTTCALAYASDAAPGTVYLATVDQSGLALTSTLVHTLPATPVAVAVSANALNVYTVAATAQLVEVGTHALPNLTGGTVATVVSAGVDTYRRVDVVATATSAVVYWQEAEAATANYNHRACWKLIGGSTTTLLHSKLASKAFLRDTDVFTHVLQESDLQSTYFLVRSDGHICGKYNSGLAGSQCTKPRLPNVQSLGDDQYAVALRTKRRLDIATSTVSADRYTHDNFKRTVHTFGAESATFHAVQAGGATYIAGGLLWQYDGGTPVESGFLLFPENGSYALLATGTPAVPNGTYNYRVYYEWTNGSGERERSSAVPFQVVNAAGARRIEVTAPTLAHTLKTGTRANVALVFYRTESLGTTYYRCSSPDPTTTGENCWTNNSTTVDSVTFIDNMTDAVLRTKELDYQNSGEFDNTAPDAATVLAQTSSRLFLAGGTIPSNTVYHSKQRGLGQPAGEFNGNLTIRIDEAGGPITAIAEINGDLIIFKEGRIYGLSGEGPNDVGGGNYYGQPRLIASDVGCTRPRTVVLVPDGLMFVSGRGIYLLGQGGVQYIGAEVEGFNDLTYVSAQVIPEQNIVVFLSADGVAVVYDYLFRQWGTWTNHTGLDSVVWQDTYCFLDPDGRVLRQSPGAYTDGGVPFSLHFRMAPIRPPEAGIQDWWRLRRASVIGEYLSPHDLVMSLTYDRDTWATETVTWHPDDVLNLSEWGDDDLTWGDPDELWGGTGTREYQFELRCKHQKCETVTFDFYDIPGLPSGAGYELTELALEWAPKAGLNKQSATRKV